MEEIQPFFEKYYLLPYAFAFLIGCVSGLAELASRYKDHPVRMLSYFSSNIYLLINGFCSVLALWFISEFDINIGSVGETEPGRIILAGLSSMLILRSSFASIKQGDKSIDAGFAAISQVFLNSADRSFDQKRSYKNLQKVSKIVKDIDFDKAQKSLPTLCLTLMKNTSIEEQRVIGKEVANLNKLDIDNFTKSILLVIIISEITDTELLKEAVDTLYDSIKLTDEQIERISNYKVSLKKIEDLKKKFKD